MQNTPWGKPVAQKRIAHGIVHFSTASGWIGLRVSVDRMKVIEMRFPSLIPEDGACWLSERRDIVFAIVSWPESWTHEEVKNAVESMAEIYDGKHLKEMEASCQPAIKKAMVSPIEVAKNVIQDEARPVEDEVILDHSSEDCSSNSLFDVINKRLNSIREQIQANENTGTLEFFS